MLFLSTRQRLQLGDPDWDSYIKWIGLPQLDEVRTVDVTLNPYVNRCGSLYCDPSEINDVIDMLPKPSSSREYYLLAVSVDAETWSEVFEGFARRLNRYGLLSLEDARQVQKLLLVEWRPDNPHASADIWATFAKES